MGVEDRAGDAERLFYGPGRVVRIGMVDYGHHAVNPVLKGFIAGHYDAISSGDQVLDFGFYRGVNPEVELFCYFNSFMLGLDQPAPVDEGAYLHDGSVGAGEWGPSNRLGKFFDGDFYYAMDPGSVAWQEHSRSEIQSVVDAGFDGVMVDDVFAHLMHEGHFSAGEPMVIGTPGGYTEFSVMPGWYDAQGSHGGWDSYLGALGQEIDGLVIYNGINDLAEDGAAIELALHPAGYRDGCDGSIQEGFVYSGKWVKNPADGLVGDEFWEATVGVLMDVPAGKRHSVVSYGDANYFRARVYALGSFLIGYDPSRRDTFYYTPDEFTLAWMPEWEIALGSPVESHGTLDGYRDAYHAVFIRRFTNGVVIVNPYGESSGLIPLGEKMFEVREAGEIVEMNGTAIGTGDGLAFVGVKSVVVDGYSAVILLQP